MPTFRIVWLKLSLDGKLCLRDEKECCVSTTSSSLAVAEEHGSATLYACVVSDWLNPLSLGIVSAFGYIDNLAYNYT